MSPQKRPRNDQPFPAWPIPGSELNQAADRFQCAYHRNNPRDEHPTCPPPPVSDTVRPGAVRPSAMRPSAMRPSAVVTAQSSCGNTILAPSRQFPVSASPRQHPPSSRPHIPHAPTTTATATAATTAVAPHEHHERHPTTRGTDPLNDHHRAGDKHVVHAQRPCVTTSHGAQRPVGVTLRPRPASRWRSRWGWPRWPRARGH